MDEPIGSFSPVQGERCGNLFTKGQRNEDINCIEFEEAGIFRSIKVNVFIKLCYVCHHICKLQANADRASSILT